MNMNGVYKSGCSVVVGVRLPVSDTLDGHGTTNKLLEIKFFGEFGICLCTKNRFEYLILEEDHPMIHILCKF